MEKMADMNPAQQLEFCDSPDIVADAASVKPPSTTANYDSNVTMNTFPPIQGGDGVTDQSKGPADMEGLTVVWTKNWLIAAYAA
jgi:hypothetical protein